MQQHEVPTVVAKKGLTVPGGLKENLGITQTETIKLGRRVG
jgi:hypothetical protein